MPQTLRRTDAHVVGRESEVALLDQFFAVDVAAALVLTGGPGAGKTTLWEAGRGVARQHGLRVLSARPSDAETGLSFAALADLLDEVDLGALAAVPAPQLRSLEVALLRAEPEGAPPESLAISAGFLNALRALAYHQPLLVAVDDVQWLDPSSSDVLVFAARRLSGHPIRFLLARRPGDPSGLEQVLEPLGLEQVEVGALSLGATRRLLSERLGLALSRRVLRQVFETGQGNPLFVLELGRMLAERGVPEIGTEIPVPDRVEDLLGLRVAGLRGPTRKLLLAVALSGDLRVSQLAAIADLVALDDAVEAGLLLVDGDRVRPSHPLLAAAAKSRSRAAERRALHLELAGAVTDEELRARHLALATEAPDAELATTLEAAAGAASMRGAWQQALELAQHALRLTPPGSAERPDRLLALALYLAVAGEKQRLTELLSAELDSLPSGAARVRAYLLLPGGVVRSNEDIRRSLELALAESRSDPALRASVLGEMATNEAVTRVARIHEAEEWALEALPASRQAGADSERPALYALGWARSLRGRPIDDICERFHAASPAESYILASPERVAGQRLVWRGDIDRARTVLTGLLALADERGELISYALQRLHVCELELRIGDWEAAARLLEEWAEFDRELLNWPMYERCRALLAAGRGLPAEAEQWAIEAIGRSEAVGVRWDWLEALRARGIGALLAHEPGTAAESLRAVWAHTRHEGVDEPGAFPVAPDLVEALAELGELGEAQAVTDRLRELAEQQEHPWGLATAKRCAALLRLASPVYDEAAAQGLAEAAAAYGDLGLRFDRARSLLVLGRAQRRHRKWAAARRSLEQAAVAFDEIGSVGWAEQARSELGRIGARRPRPAGELTPTEQRVVELAAEGRSNKEIAATLFVTVHTVEVHLSHAYAKLGVHSRGQLASRLSAAR
jgi:DNA-binding CsgD family transcriptional regulator